VMPFIVTTKSRYNGANDLGYSAVVSRQAVATLEEARRACLGALDAAHLHGSPVTVYRDAVDLPESGGTVGPLPDGKVIEVLAVDDAEYARAIDAGMNGPAVPGRAEGRPMRSELERIEQALVEAGADGLEPMGPLDEALAAVRALLAEPEEDPGVEGKNARWWADSAAYWHGQADQYKLWRDEAMRDVADLKQQLAGAVPGPGVTPYIGRFVPPDEAAIERGVEAARKIPPGARDRWQRVAKAVLRAALEPPA
jgi:hypothetical protein